MKPDPLPRALRPFTDYELVAALCVLFALLAITA